MLSRMGFLTLVCAIGCLTVLCLTAGTYRGFSSENPPAPEGITALHDIRYREGPCKQWSLDLAWKGDPNGKPRPAVVVIHGGGWLEGDNSSFASRKDGSPPAPSTWL
jgi:hypothetical protein